MADELPSPCDVREDPGVCQLKIQRNDAMDRLAIAQGDLRGVKTIEDLTKAWWRRYMSGLLVENAKLRAYWKQYVYGVGEREAGQQRFVAELDAGINNHLAAVCGWHGTMNKPTADLCSWWRKEGGK